MGIEAVKINTEPILANWKYFCTMQCREVDDLKQELIQEKNKLEEASKTKDDKKIQRYENLFNRTKKRYNLATTNMEIVNMLEELIRTGDYKISYQKQYNIFVQEYVKKQFIDFSGTGYTFKPIESLVFDGGGYLFKNGKKVIINVS